MSPPIVLNARAARRHWVSGVERWSAEVIPRLHALAPERYVTLSPAIGSRAAGQLWEQTVLPARAAALGASLVFSPANLAPLAWPRNVVVIHDAAPLREPAAYSSAYRAWHRATGIAAARRALAVLTVSDFSRTELLELVGLERDRVFVIRGGVSSRFRPDVSTEQIGRSYGLARPYVLTVATADARKNLGALSAPARRLKELGIDVVWAGGSRSHMIRAGAVDGVRALGYVSDAELPALYAGALAFVLPSRYEGFGLTCVEAMACGVPVVAADRGALPEICDGSALLVDPDDHDALAEALVTAATDDAARTRLRAAGLARAAELSWDRVALDAHALMGRLAAR